MVSWTWRIGSAYSSLPSVKTTSWRVVASVGIGFLRENWKCAPVIGPGGRLLSASASLVGKNRRPLHRALAADVHPLLDRAVGRRRRRAPPGCGEPPGPLEREAERRHGDRAGRGGGAGGGGGWASPGPASSSSSAAASSGGSGADARPMRPLSASSSVLGWSTR